jgi:hypothetical protein
MRLRNCFSRVSACQQLHWAVICLPVYNVLPTSMHLRLMQVKNSL